MPAAQLQCQCNILPHNDQTANRPLPQPITSLLCVVNTIQIKPYVCTTYSTVQKRIDLICCLCDLFKILDRATEICSPASIHIVFGHVAAAESAPTHAPMLGNTYSRPQVHDHRASFSLARESSSSLSWSLSTKSSFIETHSCTQTQTHTLGY